MWQNSYNKNTKTHTQIYHQTNVLCVYLIIAINKNMENTFYIINLIYKRKKRYYQNKINFNCNIKL